MTTAEWIGMIFAVATTVGTVVAFSVAHAVRLSSVHRNQEAMLLILERLSQESQQRLESGSRLSEAIRRLEESIERMITTSSKEHADLMRLNRDITDKVMTDHKDMLQIVSQTKEGLVSGLADISKVQAATLEVIRGHDQWQRDSSRKAS